MDSEREDVNAAGMRVRPVAAVLQGRSLDSNEQALRAGKFIGESCESIESNKICAIDANGDVSFSSYLLEGVEEQIRRSWKGSDVADEQSEGIKEVAFSISSSRGIDDTFRRSKRELSAVQSMRKKFAEDVQDHEDMGTSTTRVDGKISPVCTFPYALGAPAKDRIIGANPIHSLQKQPSSCGNRVPVVGRRMKDAEISIFDAERYFSTHEEKKAVELNGGSRIQRRSERTARNIWKGRSRSKAKGFFSDIFLDVHSSRTPRVSAASSMDGSRGYRSSSFRGTPTASSEASWNSRSGLLSRASVSAQSLPPSDAKKTTGKWCMGGFGCKCPCSGRKSVQTEPRPIASLSKSNSMVSSRLSSPINSKYDLCRSVHENPRHDESVDRIDASENDETVGVKPTSLSLPQQRGFDFTQGRRDQHYDGNGNNNNNNNININNGTMGIQMASKYHARIPSGRWKPTGGEEEIPTYVPQAEQYQDRRIHSRSISFENEADGFSFPILQPPSPVSEKSEERPRSSLEVFGSPFPESIEGMCESSEEFRQSADLRRRLTLFSLENPRKSFTFPTTRSAGSLQEIEDAAEAARENKSNADGESDSSSDLFEIESLSTQATANYTACNNNNPRRDSLESQNSDDISATETARNSFHFQSINGDPATPSAQSSCYEPSEVSLDWSIATVDTVERAQETNMTMKRYTDVSGSKRAEANLKFRVNSNRNRRTGIFGCRCEKAVSVSVPDPARPPSSYSYYRHRHYRRSIRRISGTSNHHNLALVRGKSAAESRVTDIEYAHNLQRSHSSNFASNKRSPSRSRSAHHSQETH